MKNPESIVHQYRESDPEEQLHLFLENPTLRNAFIEAELNAEAPPEKQEPPTTGR